MSTKKIVRYGFLLALSVILSYIESLTPLPFLFPGAKLGLANAIGLIALNYLGIKYYSVFGVFRVLLSAILWTGFGLTFTISLAGAVLSTLITILLFRYTKASVYGISMAGAIFHGLGQVLVVSFVYQTLFMLNYMLLLTIAGLITGFLMAILVSLMLKRMPVIY
jgi:heptaprenyl diphosphate synthase